LVFHSSTTAIRSVQVDLDGLKFSGTYRVLIYAVDGIGRFFK